MSKTGRWILTTVLVVAIALVMRTFPVPWAAMDWHAIWQKLIHTPDKRIGFLFYCVVGLVVIAVSHLYKICCRLSLDGRWLRFSSGLPFVSQWLDWALDLDAIRSQQLEFRVAPNPGGAQALRFYALTWTTSNRALGATARFLRPANWYLPGEVEIRPVSGAGFVLWNSEKAKMALRKRLEGLPLVQALSQRGIVLPSATSKPAVVGIDLMSKTRMKVAVYGFFGLLLLAVVSMLAMRDQYYFAPPPITAWLAVGSLAGFCMLVWLWGEVATEPTGHGRVVDSNATPDITQTGLHATQVVLAALVGLAAGLCAPFLTLAYANLVQTPQAQLFALRKSPMELVPQSTDAVPTIRQLAATEYWQSLKEGDAVTLPIRRGAFGLWWQFDASAVREKWIVYYDAHR
jgi:hypothetical protein